MKVAKLITTLTSILAITAIELYALRQGINGVLLAGAIAIISGLGGYEAKHLVQLFKTTIHRK